MQKPSITDKVKEWLITHFYYPESFQLSFSELRCADPACPCVQTVLKVALPSGETVTHKIGKPLIYIREWDVKGLLKA